MMLVMVLDFQLKLNLEVLELLFMIDTEVPLILDFQMEQMLEQELITVLLQEIKILRIK